jgi:hypothetical protein
MRVGRERGRQHLDRDDAIETCVTRPIDLVHTAGTDEVGDLVNAEARARL